MANYFFNWTSDAPSIDQWFHGHHFRKITDPLDIGDSILLTGGDLVFVHATDHSFWIETAQKHSTIDFVFMSRASINPEDPWLDNIHICKYPADKLIESDRVKKFFQELALGRRLWNYLLPDSTTHLLALSILCIGYLATHSDNQSEPVSLALFQMGWDKIKKDERNRLCNVDTNKRHNAINITETSGWWHAIFDGVTKRKLHEILAEEYGSKLPNEILNLSDAIFTSSINSSAVVAEAYLCLASRLKG